MPSRMRKLLKVKPKDEVAFKVEGGELEIAAAAGPLAASYMAVPALKRPLGLKEMAEIARVESAQEAAGEGF